MSTTYRNPNAGVEITVSKAADILIGPQKVPEFVARLTEFLSEVHAERAYVSRNGHAVDINVHFKDVTQHGKG